MLHPARFCAWRADRRISQALGRLHHRVVRVSGLAFQWRIRRSFVNGTATLVLRFVSGFYKLCRTWDLDYRVVSYRWKSERRNGLCVRRGRIYWYQMASDRLCGLVVRVSGYRSRGPGFDSRRFQIFWEAVAVERGPLSLAWTTEELLGRNSSGSGQKTETNDRRDPLRWPRNTLYSQKLALLRQQAAVARSA
jgi:hypothetical protein